MLKQATILVENLQNVDMPKPSDTVDTATAYNAVGGSSGTAAFNSKQHTPSQAPQPQHQNSLDHHLAPGPAHASWDGQALRATSLPAPEAQKAAAAACQPTSDSGNSSSGLPDTSAQKKGLPATKMSALSDPSTPADSQQESPAPTTTQTNKNRIAAKAHAVQSSSGRATPEPKTRQADARLVQTRQQAVSKQQLQQDAAPELQARASAAVPSSVKSRTGLRSQADGAAHTDKAAMPSLFKAQEALKKQGSIAESARGGLEAASGSSGRGAGRGRAFGRAGRRGRSRSNLFRSSTSEPQPAGKVAPDSTACLSDVRLFCACAPWLNVFCPISCKLQFSAKP